MGELSKDLIACCTLRSFHDAIPYSRFPALFSSVPDDFLHELRELVDSFSSSYEVVGESLPYRRVLGAFSPSDRVSVRLLLFDGGVGDSSPFRWAVNVPSLLSLCCGKVSFLISPCAISRGRPMSIMSTSIVISLPWMNIERSYRPSDFTLSPFPSTKVAWDGWGSS